MVRLALWSLRRKGGRVLSSGHFVACTAAALPAPLGFLSFARNDRDLSSKWAVFVEEWRFLMRFVHAGARFRGGDPGSRPGMTIKGGRDEDGGGRVEVFEEEKYRKKPSYAFCVDFSFDFWRKSDVFRGRSTLLSRQ